MLLLPPLAIEFLDGAALAWAYDNLGPVMYNAFLSPWAFLWTLAAVVLSGVCIYVLDRRAMDQCPLLDRRQKRTIALAMATITAPWLFFIPVY